MRRNRFALVVIAGMSLVLSGVLIPALTPLPAAAVATPTVTPAGAPAIAPDAPDPDIVRVGSTFYAFTSGTTWGNQIGIAENTNASPATGWTELGGAFPLIPYTQPPAAWMRPETTTSPGVYHYDNQWIMFYDAVDIYTNTYCISVATASSVTGPYSDTSGGPLVCQTWLGGSIDPQPFVDPATGAPYLIWKSNDGSSSAASQVWSQPLAANGTSLAGSPTAIFTIHSGNYGWQTTTDDPSMVYDAGAYYLFFSGGDYLSSYYPTGYVVCAGPNGGCDLNEPTDPILSGAGGTGGGMVFNDATGHWWMSYQTWAPAGCTSYGGACGREMFIASVSLPTASIPSISTTSLPAAGVGTPYSATLSATSGTGAYTWSIAAGSLPSPLSLNASTGAITGTATATSTQTVTFEVTDAQGETATKALTFQVKAGSTTVAAVNPTSTTLGSSVTYSATVAPKSGGGTPSGSVTFSIDSATMCSATLSAGTASCTSSAAPAAADTVVATYSGDATFAASTGTTTLAIPSGPYSPLTPIRICDTRAGNPSNLSGSSAQCNGIFNSGNTILSGGTLTLNVAGAFGVPADATAVVLNATVVNPIGPGFLTAYPTGASQPTASNLNFVAGQVVPNLVEVGLGTSGDVSFFASTQTDLVVDVEGYTAPSASGGAGAGLYVPLAAPARICDTRAGNVSGLNTFPYNQCNGNGNSGKTLGAGQTQNVQVSGASTIPASATAAVFNVTVVNPASAGYLTVYPEDAQRPTASNVNYVAGQVAANRVIVPLSSTGGNLGDITVFSSAGADVVVDVSGYYTGAGSSGSIFTAEGAPVRICDTRASSALNQCSGKPIGPSGSLVLNVSGLADVPSGASAVVLNLTGVTPSQGTYLSVFPGATPPGSSDLNLGAGEVRPNMVVATLNSAGKVTIFNHAGTIDVVVDVLGWYS